MAILMRPYSSLQHISGVICFLGQGLICCARCDPDAKFHPRIGLYRTWDIKRPWQPLSPAWEGPVVQHHGAAAWAPRPETLRLGMGSPQMVPPQEQRQCTGLYSDARGLARWFLVLVGFLANDFQILLLSLWLLMQDLRWLCVAFCFYCYLIIL